VGADIIPNVFHKSSVPAIVFAMVLILALALPGSSAINFAYLTPGLNAKPAASIPKIVLLTFDDGPDATTLKIAHYLSGEKLPAVFFLVGKKVQANPAAAHELAALGFDIGNHSMDHADLSRAENGRLKSEVEECSQIISDAAGKKPVYFRPPYGAFSRRLVKAAQSLGLSTLLWTVDPFDWAEPGPEVVKSRVLSAVRPGAVILLHSNHEQTLQALPGIIKGLHDKGYRFVNAAQWYSDVLGMKPGVVPAIQPEKARPSPQPEAKPVEAMPALPTLSPKVLKYDRAGENAAVFTNIDDENALFAAFRSGESAQDAGTATGNIQWQDELPARIVPEYRADFLMNRRSFAKGVYPQPAMFMLTSLEELPSLDSDFMRTLAMQGGITEMLVLQPSEGTQGEIGDFGVPAKYLPIYGFDATAVFELSSGNIGDLLALYAEKKEAIFILLGAKDFATPEARANLENATQLFLRFRQLTCERLYDPGDDLRGSWLPGDATFARFSGAGAALFLLATSSSQTITLPRSLRSLSLVSLPAGGEGLLSPLTARALMVSVDPQYLMGD
jgi:peptidoglycan/xylan/chitin deacetylase (PgdA/CDA1 family)